MRKCWLGVTLSAGLSLAAGPGSRGEDLNDAWAIALRVNQGLQSQQATSLSRGFESAAARSARYPTVRTFTFNASLTATPMISTAGIVPSSAGAGAAGGAAGAGAGAGPAAAAGGAAPYVPVLGNGQRDLPVSLVTASIPLYTGGKILRNIDAADARANAQRSEEYRTALDLKLIVASAYVGVLRAGKNLDVARSNVEQLTSFARDVRNRTEQGMAIRSDQLAADVSLNNARVLLIQSRANLASAWATYNRYLCRPVTATAPLMDLNAVPPGGDPDRLTAEAERLTSVQPDESESDALMQRAVEIRPELAGLREQARAYRAQAEATRANLRPQVSFNMANVYLGSNRTTPQDIGAATFLIDWTFTDSFQTRRQAAAQRQQEIATAKRRNDAAADVALEVRTRWLDQFQARQRVPVARLAIAQAQENVRVITDRYREQRATYTEVLDAETRRVQSLTNFYNAVYDDILAGFRLHRAVGDL
ncbi:Outer membrane efflux protein [Aquisphaera giovannonii]|uniref:Outer membrane efflux protein n=1 Tax=Aquisphaera giovannonii TaxID=406548 RepID=A0A5B9W7U4_9BACT|nr:TolC family protein [Aquisphaera giovannonii]QEH36633.1 Outer membrane efflux protein [Aquisphaera giovannonii]